MKYTGVTSRGIITPIFKQGDDLVKMICDSLLAAAEGEGFQIKNGDILGMTEAIVARAQGNYASVDDIAADVKNKLGGETVGVIFPILSRNRFSICLRGIAKGCKKIIMMLSYPSDEVGNHLVDLDLLDEKGINPYSDVLSLEKYRELFGYRKHTFTGVDYVEYYETLIRESGAEAESYANSVRNKRGISKAKDVSCDTEALCFNALDKEYCKEFYGEGQYFWFLKSHGVVGALAHCSDVVLAEENFIFPLPDAEVEYGWTGENEE